MRQKKKKLKKRSSKKRIKSNLEIYSRNLNKHIEKFEKKILSSVKLNINKL